MPMRTSTMNPVFDKFLCAVADKERELPMEMIIEDLYHENGRILKKLVQFNASKRY